MNARREYKKLNRQKIKFYFEAKKSNDFKNSKKFWNFYKTSIKLRGDVEFDSFPEELYWDGIKASTTVDQVEMFNSCFASIESSSLSSESESVKYSFDTFRLQDFHFVNSLWMKRIFYLAISTFILPYFDYCSTLLCYFSKEAINKLAKSYYISLIKLLNLKLEANSFNEINNALEKNNNNLIEPMAKSKSEINVEVFNLIKIQVSRIYKFRSLNKKCPTCYFRFRQTYKITINIVKRVIRQLYQHVCPRGRRGYN
ncbi:hypothetical protein BpHYR1_048534 [Brachionus plicatilis]|uniref:RNA-directed DNA polymerase from mobile element jockey-like n=1 Tax=Brachionus plicatilis TaxID=10195 RepID=A0A3M7QJQ5_BRAPC|nr:hypothetical protein BpHYR1_048534 [Brachionus plicatilis]